MDDRAAAHVARRELVNPGTTVGPGRAGSGRAVDGRTAGLAPATSTRRHAAARVLRGRVGRGTPWPRGSYGAREVAKRLEMNAAKLIYF